MLLFIVFVNLCQAFTLTNNTSDRLHWGMDLSNVSPVMADGIFKLLHPSGVPFMSTEDCHGPGGFLNHGESMTISVLFCPSKCNFESFS